MFEVSRADVEVSRRYWSTRPRSPLAAPIDGRHFWTPGREMLFEEPAVCPFYPGLSVIGILDGVDGRPQLIVSTPPAAAYLGGDDATVAQRAGIMAAALRDGRAGLAPDLAAGVAAWLVVAWEAVLDEIVMHGSTDPDQP